jgi:hypothetical protein
LIQAEQVRGISLALYRCQTGELSAIGGLKSQLEPLLKMPYYLSPGWLKIDPTFAPLRGNPRFERLFARG